MPISFLIEKELPRESKQWRVSYAAWEMYLVTFRRAANIRRRNFWQSLHGDDSRFDAR